MQPLYSVDHETRHNSTRREDEIDNVPAEDTPLLHRFPEDQLPVRNPATPVTVGALISILLLGVVIGIYLLIIQSNSENILPPVDTPLQLVSRSQWDPNVSRSLTLVPPPPPPPMQASHVIVVQTDTEECYSTTSCSDLLHKLQANKTSQFQQLQYNFVVATNGQMYEVLGWHTPSPMFRQYTDIMVLAFIGNFTDISPSQALINGAKMFFDESTSRHHLTPNFDIIGKNTTYKPDMLFKALTSIPQWNAELSDV